MLKNNYIGHFDRLLDISAPSNDTSGGENLTTYPSVTYSNVNAKEVKASGGESGEADQVVNTEKRAWVIRKFDRTITTEYKITIDGDDYYITSVHPYGGDRAHIVLEAEYRDA